MDEIFKGSIDFFKRCETLKQRQEGKWSMSKENFPGKEIYAYCSKFLLFNIFDHKKCISSYMTSNDQF